MRCEVLGERIERALDQGRVGDGRGALETRQPRRALSVVRKQAAVSYTHLDVYKRQELDIFQYGQPGEERKALKHHRNARGRRDHRLAKVSDGSIRRLGQAGDQAQ